MVDGMGLFGEVASEVRESRVRYVSKDASEMEG